MARSPLQLVFDRPGKRRVRRPHEAPPQPAPPSAPAPAGEGRMSQATRDRFLIGIALFALVLVVGSVWIMERLLETGKIQDCVWQGRKNCAPISAPPR
ncbi:MAG TPA: hypothetical protein VIG34_08490 [Xanthobacteraceae bacterium]